MHYKLTTKEVGTLVQLQSNVLDFVADNTSELGKTIISSQSPQDLKNLLKYTTEEDVKQIVESYTYELPTITTSDIEGLDYIVRNKQETIQFKLNGQPIAEAGAVTSIDLYGLTTSYSEGKLAVSVPQTIQYGGGGSHNSLKVSLNGTEVASPTTITELNLEGSGVTAGFTNGKVTFTIENGGSNSFSTLAVSGQSDVIADSTNDTLTLVAGSNITITTDASTDSVTINAASISDGDKGDITISGSGTTFTIDNNVVSLAKLADIATASILGRNTAGTGDPEVLSAATTKTLLSLNNVENTALSTWAGTTNLTTLGTITTGTWTGTNIALANGGTGASLTDPNADRIMFWDDSAGQVTWLSLGTNLSITGTTLDASGGNSFSTIAISGQSDVVADSSSDTLTLVAGSNITLTTNAGTDTITIAASGGGGGLTQPQAMAIQSMRF